MLLTDVKHIRLADISWPAKINQNFGFYPSNTKHNIIIIIFVYDSVQALCFRFFLFSIEPDITPGSDNPAKLRRGIIFLSARYRPR